MPERLPFVSDYLARLSRDRPDDIAVVDAHGELNYSDLKAAVERCARALVGAGVGAGDRVAALTTPSIDFFVTFLAVMEIGAIWVGVNPRYKLPEIEHVLRDSRPRLFLGIDGFEGESFADRFALAQSMSITTHIFGGDWSSLGVLASAATIDLLRAARDPDDTAVIVYTSGSTGSPKGAQLRHRGFVRGFRCYREAPRGARVLCNLPVNHVGGTNDLGCAPFIDGVTLVFANRFRPAEVIRWVRSGHVTFLNQVPTQFQLLAAHPDFGPDVWSRLDSLSFSGASMPVELIRSIRAAGTPMHTQYGSTETTIAVSETDSTATDDELATTIGVIASDVEWAVLDAGGRPSSSATEGELLLKHRDFFSGYWRNPAATEEAFVDGYLRTSDLVRVRDTDFLEHQGRAQQVFKSGGYNVHPREVEICLEQCPAVELAAVVSVPDTVFGEVGAAFVTLVEGVSPDPQVLRDWCRERLANYKVPKSITIVPELPLLHIGKVDRVQLKQWV